MLELAVAVTVSVWLSFAAPELMPDREMVCRAALMRRERLPSAFSVGALLTAPTVTVKERLVTLFCDCPSFTVTVMVAVPLACATGVKRKVPVAFGLV